MLNNNNKPTEFAQSISVKDANLWYGDFHALKNINMEIPEKKITTFIGPSGCGKSTFLKCFNRMNDLVENCRIEGESELDYGVGETNLTLLGSREDYKIKLDKGIGEAKIEGVSMADGSVYGTGENLIDIDGGVGEIKIEFSE